MKEVIGLVVIASFVGAAVVVFTDEIRNRLDKSPGWVRILSIIVPVVFAAGLALLENAGAFKRLAVFPGVMI